MTPYYEDGVTTIYAGDSLEVLPQLPAESVDAVVTDPPYGLEFMGEEWDSPARMTGHNDPSIAEGHGGRAHDHGFAAHWRPNQMQRWNEAWAREALRVAKPGAWLLAFGATRAHHRLMSGIEDAGWEITDELAWMYAQGMPKGKTTLKPAHEPIVLARKPAKRRRQLGIEECRIPFSGEADEREAKDKNRHGDFGSAPPERVAFGRDDRPQRNYEAEGRWPANVVMTEPVLGQEFSRYFIVPKASRAERNAGLETFEERPLLWSSGTKNPGSFQSEGTKKAAANFHPTVKPVALMTHLVRLVTPPGGVVLDPFLGSGTTALAAAGCGRKCIGVERDEEYLPLAPGRLRLLRGAA